MSELSYRFQKPLSAAAYSALVEHTGTTRTDARTGRDTFDLALDTDGAISWTILFVVLAVLTGAIALSAEGAVLGWTGRILCLLFVALSLSGAFSRVLPAADDTER